MVGWGWGLRLEFEAGGVGLGQVRSGQVGLGRVGSGWVEGYGCSGGISDILLMYCIGLGVGIVIGIGVGGLVRFGWFRYHVSCGNESPK